MASFSDLNLKVTNLSAKAIDELVEYAIKCKKNEYLKYFNQCLFVILFVTIHFFSNLVGYDNLGLAIEYEFPAAKKNPDSNKNKKEPRSQAVIPCAKKYELPVHLATRLKNCSRHINIYSRITIRIKQEDINTHLHHLVVSSFAFQYYNFSRYVTAKLILE